MSWKCDLDYGTRVVITSGPHKGRVGDYYNEKHDRSVKCWVSFDDGQCADFWADQIVEATAIDELGALVAE